MRGRSNLLCSSSYYDDHSHTASLHCYSFVNRWFYLDQVLLPHFSWHVHRLTLCYWFKHWTLFPNREHCSRDISTFQHCNKSVTCWWSSNYCPCLSWAALFEKWVKVQKCLHHVIIALLWLLVCGGSSETQDHFQGFRSGPVDGSRSLVITESYPSTLPRV